MSTLRDHDDRGDRKRLDGSSGLVACTPVGANPAGAPVSPAGSLALTTIVVLAKRTHCSLLITHCS
jgi:hypothetical protein